MTIGVAERRAIAMVNPWTIHKCIGGGPAGIESGHVHYKAAIANPVVALIHEHLGLLWSEIYEVRGPLELLISRSNGADVTFTYIAIHRVASRARFAGCSPAQAAVAGTSVNPVGAGV